MKFGAQVGVYRTSWEKFRDVVERCVIADAGTASGSLTTVCHRVAEQTKV